VTSTATQRSSSQSRVQFRPPSSSHPSLPDLTPVVIVGLDCTTGLQTARIFARHRVPVIGVAKDPAHSCCRTRACDRVVAADTAGPGLVDALVRLGQDVGRRMVLLPCTDPSVVLVSRAREALEPWFDFALPDVDTIETLVDKGSFYEFAQREGLPVPPTYLVQSAEELIAAAGMLQFPVVVKPALKGPEWNRSSGAKAFRVENPTDLLALYEQCAGWSDRLLVQEWIAGGDTDHYTCNCYFGVDGEPLVVFTTRKLRQWPPFGGEACLGVESRNDTVTAETIRLFKKAGYHGLGYLEMKRDARTGQYLIIEPNVGRPTGRSALAEAAGVELLYTLYCDLLGQPLPANREQKYRGAKWIHLRRDLQSSLYHWWRGELSVSEWLRSLRGLKTDALFAWRDPVPFWADLARVILNLRRKAGKRADVA
jgi:D-aspartate ligase